MPNSTYLKLTHFRPFCPPAQMRRTRVLSTSCRWADAVAGTALLLGLVACGAPDTSSPAVPEPAQMFRALTLPSHAITLSTAPGYDTLQLVATPRSALGTPLAGAPAPTFFTTDSSVRVSPTGLLTARAVRSNVKVIAELTYQGVHLADTAVITVTDVAQPHPAAHLVLQSQVPGDTTLPVPTPFSPFYGATGAKTLDVEVRDSSGAVIPEALLALSTSTAPGVATFPGSPVTTSGPVEVDFEKVISRTGPVTVTASATVYGVTVTDTLVLVLTAPRLMIITVGAQTVPGNTPGSTRTVYTASPSGSALIGVGGTVWWDNATSDSLDVVFDDPTVATADAVFDTGGGDIAPWTGGDGIQPQYLRARRFLQAGTFPWHSVKAGLSGTVVVQ